MPTTVKRKCGRPSASEGEQRLQHIVDMALKLFLENGYGATSLDKIAAAAGIAKTTIYRHFGDKKGLFETCMDMATRDFRVQLAETSLRTQSVEDALRAVALCLLDVLHKPESISLMRLLFAEAPRFPELGRVYHTRAKSIFLTEFSTFLERNVTAGALRIASIPTAADQFHHLVMASRFFDVLLGAIDIPTSAEKAQIAEDAVRMFLARYGLPAAPIAVSAPR